MARIAATVQEALDIVREESSVRISEAAAQIGMPISTLSRKMSMHDEGAHVNVHELTPIMNAFKDWDPLQTLCRINGGLFIKAPKGKAKDALKPAEYQHRFSDLLSLLMSFHESPETNKYLLLDKQLQKHMQDTATIRLKIQRGVNQIEMEL